MTEPTALELTDKLILSLEKSLGLAAGGSINTKSNNNSNSNSQKQTKMTVKDEPKKPTATATPTTTATTSGESLSSDGKYDRWTLRDESTIDYGYLSQTRGVTASSDTFPSSTTTTTDNIDAATVPFYLTTAINYTNGPAHMGHAYEGVTSDVLARYHRSVRRQTYFLTGADEHGQKIATTAAGQGKQPIDICNQYVTGFQCLNQRMLISNDDYVRTTSARHKATAQALWKRLVEKGDIYLSTYEGWYNIREETFVTDSDAALSDYKDPTSGQPLKQVKEASYFFQMSQYHSKLVEYITTINPDFIRPSQYKNLILARLQSDELRDLSISRTTFDWGIPVPDAPEHVMYVWIDALSNYLTGVNGLGLDDELVDSDPSKDLTSLWPASVHIIGKDILWFHTVIWPCLLMAAGLPLPKAVFAHGFVNDKEGKKMSKSLGNVVNPHDMLDLYSVDTFRWYLCKEAPYGGELSFSEESLRDMHNADLCDTFGNLVHRATNLCGKYCGGTVPDVPEPETPPISDWPALLQEFQDKMNIFELQSGAALVMSGFRQVNGFLTEEAPWLKKGEEHATFRQIVVRATLEAIYALAHLLLPFLPNAGRQVFNKLGTEPVSLPVLAETARRIKGGRYLKVGTKISVGDVLYSKLLSPEEQMDAAAASAKKKESLEEAQRKKKEKKAAAIAASRAKQQKGSSGGGGGGGATDQPDFTKIDIRVGKIVKVWEHEAADKLYCEEIDVGEDTPRQIASGLRPYYTLEEMQDKMVLVVCNLKAAKIVGFASHGMVLAAKGGDGNKVELVTPPDGSTIGERVTLEGMADDDERYEPLSSAQVKKKKVWELVAKDLKTTSGGIATHLGKTVVTSAGPCKALTLEDAPIS